MQDALDTKEGGDALRLREILCNEAQKTMWRSIHWATKPNENYTISLK